MILACWAMLTDLVDGFNMPIRLQWGKGATCTPLKCQIRPEIVRDGNRCPHGFTGTFEHPVCMSTCKNTGSVEDCCLGVFDDVELCPPSFMQFKDVCENTYAYAHDEHDKSTFQGNCYPGKYMIWYLGLGDAELTDV
jgi:hypothetical protein